MDSNLVLTDKNHIEINFLDYQHTSSIDLGVLSCVLADLLPELTLDSKDFQHLIIEPIIVMITGIEESFNIMRQFEGF